MYDFVSICVTGSAGARRRTTWTSRASRTSRTDHLPESERRESKSLTERFNM